MVDLTKCPGKDCPKKNECYRYRSLSERVQSYFIDTPYDKNDNSCDHFIQIQPGQILKDIDED